MYDYNFQSWLLYMSDVRSCRNLLKQGSRSFYAASLLLPGSFSQPVTALYAFCRVADDEIDRHGASHEILASMHERLDRIYEGRPGNFAVDRAFADVVRMHEIPREIPAALFEGFAWDISNRKYETLSDVFAYAARVAGTVGTMMAMIMGAREPRILSRACDLGVAMQITNIARDVGEDAAAGRLYLPRSLLREHQVDPDAWLRDPSFNPAIGAVVSRLLQEASVLYRRADWGLTKLPSSCRPAMFAARTIYAEIGAVIERHGFDSVSRRAVVSGRRKAALLAGAVRHAATTRERDSAPTLQEVRFLLDAVSRS
jgi:phytoene synthase